MQKGPNFRWMMAVHHTLPLSNSPKAERVHFFIHIMSTKSHNMQLGLRVELNLPWQLTEYPDDPESYVQPLGDQRLFRVQ